MTFRWCIYKADTNLLPDDFAISAYYFKPKVTDKPTNNVTMLRRPVTDTAAATPGQDADDHFADALNISPIAKIAAAVEESTILGDPSDDLITNQDGC